MGRSNIGNYSIVSIPRANRFFSSSPSCGCSRRFSASPIMVLVKLVRVRDPRINTHLPCLHKALFIIRTGSRAYCIDQREKRPIGISDCPLSILLSLSSGDSRFKIHQPLSREKLRARPRMSINEIFPWWMTSGERQTMLLQISNSEKAL